MDNINLDYIWSKQKEFNKNFVNFDLLTSQKQQELTKDYILHLISETSSLLDEVNWKMHHKGDSIKINRRELVLEWIDMFKYWLSIGLLWDITPDEFLQAFDEKSDLVNQRYLQEFSSRHDRTVVVCDIDGVLGDYPKTFLSYVKEEERKKGRELNFDVDNVTNLDLYQYLEGQVSTDDLKQYKSSYRESGEIRNEGALQGAVEFLDELYRQGYYIVLLTSRPFDRYKNLYLDTYVWLRSHGFKFDMLLNDSKKRDKIIKLSKESHLKCVIDDDPKIISSLLGIDSLDQIYLIDRTYNRHFEDSRVQRVENFREIIDKMEESDNE